MCCYASVLAWLGRAAHLLHLQLIGSYFLFSFFLFYLSCGVLVTVYNKNMMFSWFLFLALSMHALWFHISKILLQCPSWIYTVIIAYTFFVLDLKPVCCPLFFLLLMKFLLILSSSMFDIFNEIVFIFYFYDENRLILLNISILENSNWIHNNYTR